MKNKIILLLLYFFLGINTVYASAPPVSSSMSVEFENLVQKQEVDHGLVVNGRVNSDLTDSSKSKFVIIAIVKKAIDTEFHLQFNKFIDNIPFQWQANLTIGTPEEEGKKFYLHFFIVNQVDYERLQSMQDKSKTNRLTREQFEDYFVRKRKHLNKSAEPMVVWRKFVDL